MRYRPLWLLYIFGLSFLVFLFLLYKTSSPNYGSLEVYSSTLTHTRPIKILFWKDDVLSEQEKYSHWAGFTTAFGHSLKTPNFVGHEVKKLCQIPCEITCDKSTIGISDAVIFEVEPTSHEHLWDWLRKPLQFPQKRIGQLWVHFGYTNGEQMPLLNNSRYMELFDLNMSFAQVETSSNLPITLFCNWAGGTMEDFLLPPPAKKEKFAIFISNNCHIGGAWKRTAYVRELMRYLPIDSFGSCLNNRNDQENIEGELWRGADFGDSDRGGGNSKDAARHGDTIRRQIELASHYKFFLAFENHNASDFVSEKLSVAFRAGTLPIYMGAPNIDEWLPGEESIVRVDRFSGPKALAEYLLNLDRDPNAYARYFRWKRFGLTESFQKRLERCALYNSDCRLCERVARGPFSKAESGNRPRSERRIGSVEEPYYQWNHSYAFYFDGVSNYVEIEDSYALRLDDIFTLTAWVLPESFGDFRIVDKNTAGNIDGWSLDILKKGVRGYLRLCCAHNCWMGMKPLGTDTWYHVAVVFISTEAGQRYGLPAGISFFLNGELDYQVSFPVVLYGLARVQRNSLPLRIGRAALGNSFWHGQIDDLAIWKRALPVDEIRHVMFQLLGGRESDLVAYWNFNEGLGDLLHDSTPNHLHGIIHGNQIRWISSEVKDLVLNPWI